MHESEAKWIVTGRKGLKVARVNEKAMMEYLPHISLRDVGENYN